MEKNYNPQMIEKKWQEKWEKSKLFKVEILLFSIIRIQEFDSLIICSISFNEISFVNFIVNA